MDKRKEKTLKQVRKEIGLQRLDRLNLIKTLLDIEDIEQSIEMVKDHILDMKAQWNSEITERDQFGNALTKSELNRKITMLEFQTKKLGFNLDTRKEDLYFGLHTDSGLIDKAGSLEELRDKVKAHFELIREEYDKTIKVIKDVI